MYQFLIIFYFPALFIIVSADKSDVCYFKPCMKPNCSKTELVVWAIDGKECYIFEDDCHFSNKNCERKGANQTALVKVCKERCQKFCPQACPLYYKPFCAICGEEKQTFGNPCFMRSNTCDTGKLWTVFDDDHGCPSEASEN